MKLSAETIIESVTITEAIETIKNKALTLSQKYDNNIKIIIDANKDGFVKVNITEYNL